MDQWIQLIGRAKAIIDNGMCRVGPRLDRESRQDAFLTRGAGRSIDLSDAVVQLCSHDHANEALPILRALTEVGVAMRWVAAADADSDRAGAALAELQAGSWDEGWSDERVSKRAEEAGLTTEDLSAVLRSSMMFFVGGRSAIPWGHVFFEPGQSGASATTVLRLSARMMGHVLRSLEEHWNGCFPGAEALWE